MQLSPLAVWTRELAGLDTARVRELAGTLESFGFGGVWVPGGAGDGRPVLEMLDAVLAGTTHLVAATGIVNIWGGPARATGDTARSIAAAHDGRLLLGIGVGHRERLSEGDDAQQAAARQWTPLEAIEAYLDELDDVGLDAGHRVIAALSRRMLELSRERAAGAHPYHATPEHTQWARSVLGVGPLLVPEQTVVLETDAATARRIAREHLALYLRLGNYARNWLSLGFTEDDVAGGGSDRLIDAVVAWGDDASVASRVRSHLEAGADQVAVQVLGTGGQPPVDAWRRLAGLVQAT